MPIMLPDFDEETADLWDTLRKELRYHGVFNASIVLWDYAGTYGIRVTYLSHLIGTDYGMTLKKRLAFALRAIRSDSHYKART